jgi:hypothetical protein
MAYIVRVEILQDADSADEAREIVATILDRAADNDYRFDRDCWTIPEKPELVADPE